MIYNYQDYIYDIAMELMALGAHYELYVLELQQ